MNKNTVMGFVIVVIVLGGGYLLLKRAPAQPGTYVPPSGTVGTTDQTTGGTTTPPAPAETPSAPTVTTNPNVGVSSSTALVNGQIKQNGAAATYWFDYGETASLGMQNTAQAIGSGYSLAYAPAYLVGLKANTLYYFRLSAKNNFGTVSGATYTFRTNGTPPPHGTVPAATTAAATNVSRTEANMNGRITPNGSATTYWFEYGKTASLGNVTTFQTLGSPTAASPVSVDVTILEPLTRYYFRLNAQNEYGTINGAVMNFTTTGPAAAGQPTVTTSTAANVSSQTAQLNGKIFPNGAETTYWFEYSTDPALATIVNSGTPQKTISAGSAATNVSANLAGLTKSTKYYYRLVGRNTYGTIYGSIASFTTRS